MSQAFFVGCSTRVNRWKHWCPSSPKFGVSVENIRTRPSTKHHTWLGWRLVVGGWCLMCLALVAVGCACPRIGLVTALVADLAGLLGCVVRAPGNGRSGYSSRATASFILRASSNMVPCHSEQNGCYKWVVNGHL